MAQQVLTVFFLKLALVLHTDITAIAVITKFDLQRFDGLADKIMYILIFSIFILVPSGTLSIYQLHTRDTSFISF